MSGYVLAAVRGDALTFTDFGEQVLSARSSDSQVEIIHKFSTTEKQSKLGRCVWNSDSSLMANVVTGLSGTKKVVLTNPSLQKVTSTCLELAGLNGIVRDLNFAGKSLLAVGQQRKISIFDFAAQKVRKEFSLQHGIHKLTCMAVNAKESHVAVGCDNGSLQLVNIVSGVVSQPISTSSKLQYVVGVKYNPFTPSTLAGCTESGRVAVWDANANKLVHEFAEHRAPATGLVFSPVNQSLMISTAEDKKCVMYDSEKKRKLTSFRVADPLTSVDMHRDGTTLALGDSKGQVSLYDLRSTQTPLFVHKPSGQGAAARTSSVSFLNSHFGSAATKGKPEGSVNAMTKKTSGSAIYNDIKENIRATEESSNNTEVGNRTGNGGNDSVCSLFSPLRESSPVVGLMPPGHPPGAGQNLTSDLRPPLRRLSSTDSLFSPLRENTSFGNIENTSVGPGGLGGSLCRTPKTAPSSQFNSPLLPIKEESSSPKKLPNLPPGGHSAIKPKPLASQPDQVDKATPIVQDYIVEAPPTTPLSSLKGSELKEAGNSPKPVEDHTEPSKSQESQNGNPLSGVDILPQNPPQISDIRAMMLAFPETLSTDPHLKKPAEKGQENSNSSGDEDGAAGFNLHHKYLRAMQSEALDDFYTDIKRHLWHLDYTLVKNFQDLHDHMDQIRSDFRAENDALARENQRLREENEELKKTRKYYQA